MYRTAWNPADVPVVVDAEGRTIGGGEYGTVDTTDSAAKALLDAESLLLVSDPPSDADINPALRAALAATEARQVAAVALRGQDKADLVTLAEEHAPDLADADKPDLVDGLAARGVVAPENDKTPVKKAAKTTTTSERA